MQWDETTNAGFSAGKPWIKVNENYRTVNVQRSKAQVNSILNTYKALLKLRNSEKTLQYGSYEKLEQNDGRIQFTRSFSGDKISVIVNFGNELKIKLPAGSKVLMGDIRLKTNDFLIYRN